MPYGWTRLKTRIKNAALLRYSINLTTVHLFCFLFSLAQRQTCDVQFEWSLMGSHFYGRLNTGYWPSVRSRWLDVGKDKKKERGQYPAIVNEQIWSIENLYGKKHYFLAGHNRGAFHSTKNFEIFETGTNGMTISRSGRKSGNSSISDKRTIEPEILEIEGWK